MQHIKDAIYDLQIGPAEIAAAREPNSFVVSFDDRYGKPVHALVSGSSPYGDVAQELKALYEGRTQAVR